MLITVLPMSAQTQKYMGAYITDEYSENGLGMTGSPGTYSVVAEIPSELLLAYDGGKVVGMRFALASTANTSKCFILDVTGGDIDTLAVAPVTSSKIGWNYVAFDKPFTLDLATMKYLLLGYDYEQTSSNYPISVVNEGTICNSYIGIGDQFYDYGLKSYGNLCVQAIVEKDYAKLGVAGFDMDDVYVQKGGSATASATFMNVGTEGVYSISYTVTNGGVTSKEKNQFVLPTTDFGSMLTIDFPIEASSQRGEQDITVTITKVNGEANPCSANNISSTLYTLEKIFNHRVAVEEFTGTGCMFCPKGIQGMANLKQAFGESVIPIVLHQYTRSTSKDAMYINVNNYKALDFDAAPECMIERGGLLDPYYGSNLSIKEDFAIQLKKIAKAGVSVYGVWNEDMKSVDAHATVEALADNSTFDIEYVLVADSLTGTTTAWRQQNAFISYNPDELPSDLRKFSTGGEYGTNPITGLIFEDVAIASSYENGINKAESLGTLNAYTPVQSSCTINMPTSTTLLNAIDYNKVYIIALVIDQNTGRIVNADKKKVGDLTGIREIEAVETVESNAVYNLAGQRVGNNYKGVVIKNGRKMFQK